MTAPRKTALSLFITVLLFAVFTVASFTGIFELVEARFYNPRVTASISEDLARETGLIEVFLTTAMRQIEDSIAQPAVKRSFLVNQTDDDIYERSYIFARLHETLDGLQWARFIDSGGNRIHYSTWKGDLLREDAASAVYRMYTDAAYYIPLEQLLPAQDENMRVIFDSAGERIVFSLPFYDALDAYRGLAVFALSAQAVQNKLFAETSAGLGKLYLTALPRGFVRGIPADSSEGLLPSVEESWRESGAASKTGISVIESGGGRARLVLLSAKTAQGYFVGRLVNEEAFVLPSSLKALLLVLFFVSVFIILFLIMNLRQDPLTVVRHRLKNLQLNLIEEYYDQKTDVELNKWGLNLMKRREEIRAELKAGLRIAPGKKQDEEINVFIDKSWNELLAAIGGRLERTVNDEEIQEALNRLNNTLAGLVEKLPLEGKTSAPSGKAGTLPSDLTGGQPETAGGDNALISAFAAEVPVALSAEDEDEKKDAENEDAGVSDKAAEYIEGIEDAQIIESFDDDIKSEFDIEKERESLSEIVELEAVEVEAVEEEAQPAADDGRGGFVSRFDEEASKVEFGEIEAVEEADDEPLAIEIEMSSPFGKAEEYNSDIKDFVEKDVFDDISSTDDATPANEAQNDETRFFHPGRGLAWKAELINARGDSSVPQGNISTNSISVPSAAPGIIREEDGVAYIETSALNTDGDADEDSLDPRIKGLVDSVLQR